MQKNRKLLRHALLTFAAMLALGFAFLLTNVHAGSLEEHHLMPYQLYHGTLYTGNPEKTFTMMDQTYTYGITRTEYNEMNATFNLDGAIDRVSFVIGHMDGGNTAKAVLKVYYDDVYQPDALINLNGDMVNRTVTLNTEGVKKMHLSMNDTDGDYAIANIVQTSVHTYQSAITKIVTAKEAGIRTFTCTECGSSYMETIPARTWCDPYFFPYQSSHLKKYDEVEGSSTYFTVMGEKHYQGLARWEFNAATALFNLSQNYESFTFTVGHIDGKQTPKSVLSYYVDGVQVGTVDLFYDMTNQTVTIDNLSSATQIKLSMNDTDGDYAIFDIHAEPKNKTPMEHSYVAEETMAAQFGVTGIMTHRCADCGAFYTSVIPALKRSLKDAAVTAALAKTSYAYTGKAKSPAATVKFGDTLLRKGTDYTVTYAGNVKPGTATATIKGKGSYTGSIKLSFKITKIAQSPTVKAKAVAVKYATVKSKKVGVKVSYYLAAKNLKGTVSIKKVAGDAKVTVSSATNGLIIAKGTKKGTHKIKVRITAAGTSIYKKYTKDVVVTVTVK